MSKRRLARDLDDLTQATLGGLDPDDRLTLFLRAAADRNEASLARLRETAPVTRYVATERAYTERGRWAIQLLGHVVYDLHTTALHFELIEQRQRTHMLAQIFREGPPTAARSMGSDDLRRERRSTFTDLYTTYHAARRFATAELGVDLETWVRLRDDGPAVLAVVEAILADDDDVQLAEQELDESGDTTEGAEHGSLDALVDVRYEGLVKSWETVIREGSR